MIARITVEDNDFTADLEEFARTIFQRLIDLPREEIEKGNLAYFSQFEKCCAIVNPNKDQFFDGTEDCEDYKLLSQWIHQAWEVMVDRKYEASPDTAMYLKENFKVRLVHSIKEEWLNGEVVFAFFDGNKFLTM